MRLSGRAKVAERQLRSLRKNYGKRSLALEKRWGERPANLV